ncbi:MAG TPA: aminotransferase class I/II-fold pyridoxal phosphate-dependent enzyme [Candidatus Limnocylindria bacterium]|nr:aminotransferase class I/II-fold pyridoxal phosphate-dependent enzyme [Candidatus Limnocylindria bacterium]
MRAARSLPSGTGVPVVPPLVQSVAFDYGSAAEQDAVFGNERPGYVYGRYGTPTTAALERALAELDGVEAATCFVTGMAAIAAAVDACAVARGGRVVAQEDCYGQTRALFERWKRERGADIAFVDTTDHEAVEEALRTRPTTLLYAEAIANPLLRVNDVATLARLAGENGAALAVDATFATPVLFRPASLGATMVIHSLTKYVNGHGDVMGGVVGGSEELGRAMRDRTILDGAYLPPHEAWLVVRGMRTLALRLRRQSESALALARHVARHPKVARVRYPGLPDHPQHELATRQFGGLYGGVVSFALREDTKEAAFRFLDALELAASATTIGDLFTEVLYPAISSHRRLAPEERNRLGITDGFLRISVGIEDLSDIVADIDRALDRV